MPQFGIEDLTVNINTVDRPRLLEACLDSLLRTTPPGAPLQIVFNGTPNETRERTIAQASSWQGPTSFVHLSEMLSIDESHNRALEGVSTSLVNFMGDDDLVLSNRFDSILNAFNTLEPLPAVVTTFARRMAGDAFYPNLASNKDLGSTTIQEWEEFHATGRAYELLWPGAVLRTDLLRQVGGFEARFAESFDNRIFSQMSFIGPVIALPERNFGFRVHSGSLSTSKWKVQSEVVRYVQVCHEANLQDIEEPTFLEFQRAEASDPVYVRARRRLRDQSRMHFRRGGEMMLKGRRLDGAKDLAASAVFWPPAFVEKVRDQFGSSFPFRR